MALEYDGGARGFLDSGERRRTFGRHPLPTPRTRHSDQSYQKRTFRDYKSLTHISGKTSSFLVLYFALLRQHNLARQDSNLRAHAHPKTRIAAWKPTRSSKLVFNRHKHQLQPHNLSHASKTRKLTRLSEHQSLMILGKAPHASEKRLELIPISSMGSHISSNGTAMVELDSIGESEQSTAMNMLPTDVQTPSPPESTSPLTNPESSSTKLTQGQHRGDVQAVERSTALPMGCSVKRMLRKRKASCNSLLLLDVTNAKQRKGKKLKVITQISKPQEAVNIDSRSCTANDLPIFAKPQSLPCTNNLNAAPTTIGLGWDRQKHETSSSPLKHTPMTDLLSSSSSKKYVASEEQISEMADGLDSEIFHRFLNKIEHPQDIHHRGSTTNNSQESASQRLTDNQSPSTDGDLALPSNSQTRRNSVLSSRREASYNRLCSSITQHASSHDSPAPSPPTKRGGRNASGRGRGGFTNGRGRGRGRGNASGGGGGRDRGDSPDPPIKHVLTPEERATMSHIRARQLELKRLFTVVGGQQREILDALAARDLAKLMKKSKAHTKVPEYGELCAELDEKMQIAQDLAKTRLETEKAHVEKALSDEIRIIEEQFQTRIQEAKMEHVKGAEGDLIIFKNAHRAANDDTGTEAGSDVGTYPRYHECPEPDSRIRGYSSTQITDEKSLKQQLASYDEQAQREVMDDDVVEPQNQSMAEQRASKEEEDKFHLHQIEDLILVADDELKKIENQPVPPPTYASENPQFALSRLADASELVLRKQREQSYAFVPLTPAEAPRFARDNIVSEPHLPPPPSMIPPLQQIVATPTVPIVKKPTPRRQKKAQSNLKQASQRVDQPDVTISSGTSTLPAIAPAPARMPPPPPSPMHSLPRPPPLHPMGEYPMTPYSQSMPPLPPPPQPLSAPQSALSPRRPSQQFTFTPTQTPGQQYFSPTTPPNSFPPGPAPVATQSKMHNTFVNQTVESRHQADIARQNAARTQGQGMGPRGGKRILLPKV